MAGVPAVEWPEIGRVEMGTNSEAARRQRVERLLEFLRVSKFPRAGVSFPRRRRRLYRGK
jgi:hypothetical protein